MHLRVTKSAYKPHDTVMVSRTTHTHVRTCLLFQIKIQQMSNQSENAVLVPLSRKPEWIHMISRCAFCNTVLQSKLDYGVAVDDEVYGVCHDTNCVSAQVEQSVQCRVKSQLDACKQELLQAQRRIHELQTMATRHVSEDEDSEDYHDHDHEDDDDYDLVSVQRRMSSRYNSHDEVDDEDEDRSEQEY
jgi:hypothetical protein